MAKRWYYTFKTFQGHTCEVDICDETFTGTAIELNKDVAGSPGCPSDNPVVIEEDNSDDLLDVVRIKTGYLNFVELTTNGLQDMFPQRNGSFEVFIFLNKPANVSYDAAAAEDYMTFHGYIQAQSFKNDYLGYRPNIKLPIQSVMGVLQDQPIDTGNSTIIRVFANSFSNYKYLVLPRLVYETYDEYNENVLEMGISQTILTPNNKEYNYGLKNDPDDDTEEAPLPLSPITKSEFVKKFCHTFGMISHDVGNMLVFTKIGYTGNYIKCLNATDWDDHMSVIGTGGTVVSRASTFYFANDKNKVSFVDSLKRVLMTWDDRNLPQSADFSIASYKTVRGEGLSMLEYQGCQIKSNRWYTQTLGIENSTFIVGNGEHEMIEANGSGTLVPLFAYTFTFFGRYNNIHVEADKDYNNSWPVISVFNGYSYFNFQYDPEDPSSEYWIDQISYGTVHFDPNGVADEPIVTGGWSRGNLVVTFYTGSGTHLRIKKLEIQNNATTNKYITSQEHTNKQSYQLDSASLLEKEADIDFWAYGLGYFYKPTFDYLGKSQRNLALYLRKKANVSELSLLISKFGVKSGDTNNRVISTRHNVRDDIYELQVMGNEYF